MALSESEIAEMLEPFVGSTKLSSNRLGAIETYVELLRKWNAKINLTAVRDPAEIVSRHFGESFFAARQLFPSGFEKLTAIDVGSGAGFPGIPLKIWNAELELTLVEANQKKATFLREVIRALNLKDARVLANRADEVRDRADVVALRAVEKFAEIVVQAGRLVKAGGRLALLIGQSQVRMAQEFVPDIQWASPVEIPKSRNRVLLVGRLAA